MRFYCATRLPPDGPLVLTGDTAHRAARVLRMRAGDTLWLFDGTGREVEAVIGTVERGSVTVMITAELPPAPPAPPFFLYQALIRPNRFELLLEKAAELGVAAIRPIISARCQVRPEELGAVRGERWGRILAEAAEQSGRRTVPDLSAPLRLETALTAAPGLRLLPWERERASAPRLGDTLRTAVRDGPPPALSMFIGPEGGFAPEEIEAARAAGAEPVSLGPLILRAETAAIAALAIATDAWTGSRQPASGMRGDGEAGSDRPGAAPLSAES